MKRNDIKDWNNGQPRQLANNQIIALQGRSFRIDCLQGIIWVTWPNGHERVVQKGQSFSLASKGVVCVQAFAASTVSIRTCNGHQLFRLPRSCQGDTRTGIPATASSQA